MCVDAKQSSSGARRTKLSEREREREREKCFI